jgi:uncharacterized membrane protein YvlD (DUF360 family)
MVSAFGSFQGSGKLGFKFDNSESGELVESNEGVQLRLTVITVHIRPVVVQLSHPVTLVVITCGIYPATHH